jgi:hypothetical protein
MKEQFTTSAVVLKGWEGRKSTALRQNENTIQRHSQMFSMNGAHNDVQKLTIVELEFLAVVGKRVPYLSRVV